MNNDFDYVWSTLYPIWLKYCGVCDEFKILKSKWRYFSTEDFSPLPSLNSTFQRVDTLIKETERFFTPLFERNRADSRANFNHNLALERIQDIQNRFIELSQFLGILKFVFFQRMVSSEIPHTVSGIPLSPERTIGNEMLYIAADNVAKSYKNCIRIDKELEWDEIISFVYPIQVPYFFGGLTYPSRFLKQFHVLISEEQKHFLGSYILLAHEISHMVHFKLSNNGDLFPFWFKLIWEKTYKNQLTEFKKEIDNLQKDYNCDLNCQYYKCLNTYFYDTSSNCLELQQFIADIIAYLIGGPATCYFLIDSFLNAGTIRYLPLRPAFLQGFFARKEERTIVELLDSEIINMKENWKIYFNRENVKFGASCINCNVDPHERCFDLFRRLGLKCGIAFAKEDERILGMKSAEWPKLELPITYTGKDSLISSLIQNKFSISEEEEQEITENLNNRRFCVNIDPRKILHCYYMIHRRGETPPDYTTTLFSLAFNECI